MSSSGATTAATSAVSVRQDAVVLAFQLKEVPPVPRHNSLHIMRGRKSVQQWIHGRIQGQQVHHDEGVDVNWGWVGCQSGKCLINQLF